MRPMRASLIQLSKCLLLTLAFGLPVFNAQGGGFELTNGGDTIFCEPSPENPISGYYTLDYLLEYRDRGSFADLEKVESWEASRERISRLIARLYPALLPNFREFVDLIENTKDLSAARVWTVAELGLWDLKDEDITRRLPENCLSTTASGKQIPRLTQTVLRHMNQDALIYEFDPRVLSRQKHESPMQYSFFMIHEWLWDLTKDVHVVRKLNWLLHSRELETYSAEGFQTLFRRLQVFKVKLPACAKSKYLRLKLLAEFGRSCAEISDEDLLLVKSLDLSELNANFLFRIGDFWGLSRLTTLNLSGNSNLFRYLPVHGFQALHSLQKLDLRNSDLSSLPDWFFEDLAELELLDLRGNPSLIVDSRFKKLRALRELRMDASVPFLDEMLPESLETLVRK